MSKSTFLALFLGFCAAWTSPSAHAQTATGWGCTQSAGAAGNQTNNSLTTTRQAQQGPAAFNAGSSIAQTGTYELGHASVNQAALPYDGYTFGFGSGASFPQAAGAGITGAINAAANGCWGAAAGDLLQGTNFNLGVGGGQSGVPFMGGSIPLGSQGQSAQGQYVSPSTWGPGGGTMATFGSTIGGPLNGSSNSVGGLINGVLKGGGGLNGLMNGTPGGVMSIPGF